MTKLLFLGFDGLDYDLLNDSLRLNQDAFLNKIDGSLLLMTPEDDGLSTGPCWATIYTGLAKNHHGITSIWPNSKAFKSLPFPCIWDILNEHDISVGLFGLPITYPPKAIRKFWVSGFPTPIPKTKFNDGAIIAFPSFIQEKYLSEHLVDMVQVGHGKNGLEDWGNPSVMGKRAVRWQDDFRERKKTNKQYPYEICDAVLANQLPTIKRLFSDIPIDVAFIQFSFVDHMGHLLPPCPESRSTLLHVMYPRINKVIKDLWHFFKPENLVIASDHGFKGDATTPSTNDPNYGNPHSPEAVAYFHGPNIMKDYKCEFSNMDLMPTILFMLDIPHPKVDGKVHYDLFKSQQFSKKDKEEINEKLRALGYI